MRGLTRSSPCLIFKQRQIGITPFAVLKHINRLGLFLKVISDKAPSNSLAWLASGRPELSAARTGKAPAESK